jgi:hypothetical protein
MKPEKIYVQDLEVNDRLLPFAFTRKELIEIARRTLAERSNTIDLDAAGAAGQLSYIHGTRQLRLLAISKGYQVNRQRNIESSKHPTTGIMVTYQNVDIACSKMHSPKAISGKKSGSAEAIEQAQGSLFTSREAPFVVDIKSIRELNSSLWYLCVSFTDDAFSVELSLPASVSGDNFSGFIERIFIASGQEWLGKPAETTDGDYAEFEPLIRRK